MHQFANAGGVSGLSGNKAKISAGRKFSFKKKKKKKRWLRSIKRKTTPPPPPLSLSLTHTHKNKKTKNKKPGKTTTNVKNRLDGWLWFDTVHCIDRSHTIDLNAVTIISVSATDHYPPDCRPLRCKHNMLFTPKSTVCIHLENICKKITYAN